MVDDTSTPPEDSAPVPEVESATEQPASVGEVATTEGEADVHPAPETAANAEEPRAEAPPPQASSTIQRKIAWTDADRRAAREEHTRRKEAHLDAILDLAKRQIRISNRDIVREVHVSRNSATLYADILVKRGQLKRGGRARGVFYVLQSLEKN